MKTAEIEIQNLRNKYSNNSVIRPLIQHCEDNSISFEFLKETVPAPNGIKSFNSKSIYYMKIGENLIKQEENDCRWDDLCKLITTAYDYLEMEQPQMLINSKGFRRKQ